MSSEDLGNGFRHHGVATPISNHRGIVATVDGEGRNVVLLWLYDHRGGYALLLIDGATGKTEQFPMPYPPGGDGPFASILSSRNRFYTHFNSHFCEFDPAQRAFTFHAETVPQMAMGMTEDDEGRIWSVTYPDSAVASYEPAAGTFRDYGSVYEQNWRQYQRYVAADDAGWVYFGVGNTASQLVALDPESGESRAILPEAERRTGSGYVYRDLDGRVYGLALDGQEEAGWYELHQGRSRKIGRLARKRPKPITTSHQGLFHREFPDGLRVTTCDLVEKVLEVEDRKTGRASSVSFDYDSDGAHLMGLAAAPDHTICGGTAFPMRFFSYDPQTDEWVNRASHGQWNTVARHVDRFFVGGYTGGFLLEWDPSRPWETTEKDKAGCNPEFLTQVAPAINRPHDLLPFTDGSRVVLAGTPGYGYTGGGLLIWDRQAQSQVLLEHDDLIADHSPFSLFELPEDQILIGTTVAPGTGGEQKADVAELLILDIDSKQVIWHAPALEGVSEYTDLWPALDGVAYGFADRRRFFVFDPATRTVVYERDTEADFGLTSYQQGPRIFARGPDGQILVLFERGVARVRAEAPHQFTWLADAPVPIQVGGDVLDGRLYFASGSHLYSWEVDG